MSANAEWIAGTEGTAIALSAATAKTVVAVTAASGKQITVTQIGFNFDGTSATAAPVLVELVQSDGNAAGTASTVTARLWRGDGSATTGVTAKKTYTVEPTNLTAIWSFRADPNKGLVVIDFPLGREPQSLVAKLLGLRMNAPATVNVDVWMRFEGGG